MSLPAPETSHRGRPAGAAGRAHRRRRPAVAPLPARAQATTVQLLQNTVNALPGCLRWRPTGACFWLKCSVYPPRCKVVYSLRMEHYVPEVIVSTWHDPAQHPWEDFGRPVAQAVNGAGQVGVERDARLGWQFHAGARAPWCSAMPMPSQTRCPCWASWPAGGSMAEMPSLVALPGPQEMSRFPSQMGAIAQSWGSVPGTVAAGVVAQAQRLANVPAQLASLPGRISSATGSLGGVLSQQMPVDLPGGGAGSAPEAGGQVDMGALARRGPGGAGHGRLGCQFGLLLPRHSGAVRAVFSFAAGWLDLARPAAGRDAVPAVLDTRPGRGGELPRQTPGAASTRARVA